MPVQATQAAAVSWPSPEPRDVWSSGTWPPWAAALRSSGASLKSRRYPCLHPVADELALGRGGLPTPMPVVLCRGLPMPLSNPRDRGDMCLLRGCAKEDFRRSSLEEGVVMMGRPLQKFSLHLAKLFH